VKPHDTRLQPARSVVPRRGASAVEQCRLRRQPDRRDLRCSPTATRDVTRGPPIYSGRE